MQVAVILRNVDRRCTDPGAVLDSSVEPVERGGVTTDDLFFYRDRNVGKFTFDEILGIGPNSVGMREITTPHDIVLTQYVEQAKSDGVALVSRKALSLPIFGRSHG